MVFKYVTSTLRDLEYRTFFKYGWLLFAVVTAIIVGVSGYGFYYWYSSSRNQQAQAALMDVLQEYNRLSNQKEDNNAQLQQYAQRVENDYKQYKGTAFGSEFLAVQANIALKQQDMKKATELLAQAVQESKNPLIKNSLQTKHALVMIDNPDEHIKNDGLTLLTKLAQDKANSQQDMALYYLGLYHYIDGQKEQARTVWTTLIQEFMQATIAPSEWASLAQQKLSTLS